MQWLKKAFAIDPPGEVMPDEQQKPVVDALCRGIVNRGLSTPALMLLEMSRPLNFVSAQLLHVLAPFIQALTDQQEHQHLALFLERRGSIDYLCNRIEQMQHNRDEQQLQSATDPTQQQY